MNDASKFAKDRLVAASRAKDTSRHLSFGLGTAAAACLLLLGVAVVDYQVILPPAARYAALAVLAGLIGFGVHRLWSMWRRPTALKEAALDAEAQSPGLGCEISTAAEYMSGERKATQAYEAELAEALQAKAASGLEKMSMPYWKRPLGPAALLGMVCACVLVFVVLATGSVTAFQRAALPWSNAAYTKVEVKPGNIEVAVGKDVEVRSVFTGRPPSDARFEWREPSSAKWQLASLTRTEQGEYVHPLKNVRTGLKYRVAGSDAVSPEFDLATYVPPEVKEWLVEVSSPNYTKLPKRVQTVPDVEAVRGSKVSFRISPTTALSKARMRFADTNQPAIDLKRGVEGFWTADLAISKDTDFWIELADARGHAGVNETAYHLKALADAAPKVEIAEPGEDMRSMATNNVPVKIVVNDDFGLDEVRLIFHKLGGEAQVVSAKRQGQTNAEFSAEIPLTAMGLKEYELVAYHAEATDNNTLDGPGVGKSQVYFIEITNEEGGECKCKNPPKGQKANLLVIQKQIIADTTELAANAPADAFAELAKRQKDAIDFGKLYLEGMTASGGAPEATLQMQAAIRDMNNAAEAFAKNSRAGALPPAESALARLYNILKMMPELQNMPTAPALAKPQQPKKPQDSQLVKVVLEAIKKKKPQEPDNKEIEAALEEAKELQEEQASLTIGMQNAGNGKAEGAGEVLMDRSGKKQGEGKKGQQMADGKKPGEGKAKADAKGKGKGKGQAKGKGKGQGQGKGEGEGQGKGEGKGKGEGEGKGEGKESPEMAKKSEANQPKDAAAEDKEAPQKPEELAEKQTELSKQAEALAEKLTQLAGKDARVGHGIPKKMKESSQKMSSAAQAMSAGNSQKAGTMGSESGGALAAAIAAMERIVQGRPELTDVSKEDFPKEYEPVISDYLKKLSYAE